MSRMQALDTSAYFDQRRNMYRRFWEAAVPYTDFVALASAEDRKLWDAMYARVAPTPNHATFLAGFTRQTRVLVTAATWSCDCIQQVPILARLAEASPAIQLRVLDRDSHPELRDEVRLCGAARVPAAVFLPEDSFECSRMGDRTLSTYRSLARKELGSDCRTGDPLLQEDEILATQQDWLNELERVQLMMRLSPYLRERYGD